MSYAFKLAGKNLIEGASASWSSCTQLTEDLSNVDPKKLSADQRYLLKICNSINAGECSIDQSIQNPGCLNHSRWLTPANRILKLYEGIKIPSEKLQALVMFIIRVYAAMWFAIKSHSSCKDGARHFHQQVARSRYLSQEQKNIIDPVLHSSSYFTHQENIILVMKVKSSRKS